MIPRTIHYVWFGESELPLLARKCIESWEKHCPDYEIIRWDESNFDIFQNQYCAEAYRQRKWAFASDYARLWVLVNHGGIYMDTDVEVLRPLDRFLYESAFSGFEAVDRVPTGIMACEKGHAFFAKLLDDYENRSFIRSNGSLDMTTNVFTMTKTFQKMGLQLNNKRQTIAGVTLYPSEFFCPKDWLTQDIHLTKNSYTIHHFDGSWTSQNTKMKHRIMRILGPSRIDKIQKIIEPFRSQSFNEY